MISIILGACSPTYENYAKTGSDPTPDTLQHMYHFCNYRIQSGKDMKRYALDLWTLVILARTYQEDISTKETGDTPDRNDSNTNAKEDDGGSGPEFYGDEESHSPNCNKDFKSVGSAPRLTRSAAKKTQEQASSKGNTSGQNIEKASVQALGSPGGKSSRINPTLKLRKARLNLESSIITHDSP